MCTFVQQKYTVNVLYSTKVNGVTFCKCFLHFCCKWGNISSVKTELNNPVWGFLTFIDDF